MSDYRINAIDDIETTGVPIWYEGRTRFYRTLYPTKFSLIKAVFVFILLWLFHRKKYRFKIRKI